MERSKAYRAGQHAYKDGFDNPSDNPYPMLSCDWHDWDAGWCDAANDDQRAPDPEDWA
ncbi:hypothetical protein [Burkholderia cenocepacia]|uniref:hypothetical protein n=1 Tax=Burkholderia cenocepacia TaxID=95486 RepID=UPI002AAF421C|nr:hypothetical protein [Burkholderia cenocepacia]